MTATEAKHEALWRSLPDIVRVKIQRQVEYGNFYTLFYKSSTPLAFKDIDTTICKLQSLGYVVEYDEVDIKEDNETVSISTDTKLTVKW